MAHTLAPAPGPTADLYRLGGHIDSGQFIVDLDIPVYYPEGETVESIISLLNQNYNIVATHLGASGNGWDEFHIVCPSADNFEQFMNWYEV